MVLVSSSKDDPFKKSNKNSSYAKEKKDVGEERIVQREQRNDDSQEQSFRPNSLDNYIGQKQLKESLNIAMLAAKQRKDPIDHVLLYGPPGLGKTTLSIIIAKEMNVNIKITSAPALEKPRDIAGILATLQPFDVLFIDEIHRLNRLTEEILYPAMEDFFLDIIIGKGKTSKIKRVPLNKFTLIGATTKAGCLTSPLRDRFGILYRLNFYEIDELTEILIRSAKILNINIDIDGAKTIAQRSRGTPRVANRLLKRVRDFAQVKGNNIINQEVAKVSLDLLNIDSQGLDLTDRLILNTIIDNYNGGPVGLETIATAINEDVSTIEDVYEPYLIQIGFLNRTQRGRIATLSAYKHLQKSIMHF